MPQDSWRLENVLILVYYCSETTRVLASLEDRQMTALAMVKVKVRLVDAAAKGLGQLKREEWMCVAPAAQELVLLALMRELLEDWHQRAGPLSRRRGEN